MRRIGLTGGIASGKTAISNALARRGLPVIDADVISRELMQPGATGHERAIEHFGDAIRDAQGHIDRARLRRRVFEQPEDRAWLEAMLHPPIRKRIEQTLAELDAEATIIVVPLLFESGFDELVDVTVAIDCPRPVQLQRLMERDGIDRSLAESMIDAQMDNNERLNRADRVIRNDGSRPADALAAELLELVADKPLASP